MAERGAVVISWGSTRPGIPVAKALEVFAGALAYYDEQQKAGRVSGYRVFGSMQTQGGFMVVEGALSDLAALQVESDSLKLLAKAGQVVNDIKTEMFAGGTPDDATQYYMTGLEAIGEAGLA